MKKKQWTVVSDAKRGGQLCTKTKICPLMYAN